VFVPMCQYLRHSTPPEKMVKRVARKEKDQRPTILSYKLKEEKRSAIEPQYHGTNNQLLLGKLTHQAHCDIEFFPASWQLSASCIGIASDRG
jgi:hypothetical protein